MSRTLITGGRVITRERVLLNGAVLVEDGKIAQVYEQLPQTLPQAVRLDAAGRFVAPGFVDIHVHGGAGHDFMTGNVESNAVICRTHLMGGTTTIVPTLSTSSLAAYEQALTALQQTEAINHHGAHIAGVHMEGPYFSESQKGAQSAEFIRHPNPDEYLYLLDKYPNILRWAVAAELPGALEMGRALIRRGVHLSIGHSDALFDEVLIAYENGYNCITHLYSGSSTVKRINAFRHAGMVEAAFYLDGMTVEIIADGKHLPPSLLKLIYKIKGPERICLITDGISAAGMDGQAGEMYDPSSKQTIIIEDGVGKLADRQSFAGSIATTAALVRNMVQLADVPLVQAVKMMTATPARMIGLRHTKGAIAAGMDADLVFFDDDIRVSTVIKAGKVLFSGKE